MKRLDDARWQVACLLLRVFPRRRPQTLQVSVPFAQRATPMVLMTLQSLRRLTFMLSRVCLPNKDIGRAASTSPTFQPTCGISSCVPTLQAGMALHNYLMGNRCQTVGRPLASSIIHGAAVFHCHPGTSKVSVLQRPLLAQTVTESCFSRPLLPSSCHCRSRKLHLYCGPGWS